MIKLESVLTAAIGCHDRNRLFCKSAAVLCHGRILQVANCSRVLFVTTLLLSLQTLQQSSVTILFYSLLTVAAF